MKRFQTTLECSHLALTGVDRLHPSHPEKLWRCDGCGYLAVPDGMGLLVRDAKTSQYHYRRIHIAVATPPSATAMQIVRELEAKICKRYATAFNAANKKIDHGVIQVGLTDLVKDALTTAFTAGQQQAACPHITLPIKCADCLALPPPSRAA